MAGHRKWADIKHKHKETTMVDTAESTTPKAPSSEVLPQAGMVVTLGKILKHLEDVEEILEDIEGRLADIETTSYGTRGYKDEDD